MRYALHRMKGKEGRKQVALQMPLSEIHKQLPKTMLEGLQMVKINDGNGKHEAKIFKVIAGKQNKKSKTPPPYHLVWYSPRFGLVKHKMLLNLCLGVVYPAYEQALKDNPKEEKKYLKFSIASEKHKPVHIVAPNSEQFYQWVLNLKQIISSLQTEDELKEYMVDTWRPQLVQDKVKLQLAETAANQNTTVAGLLKEAILKTVEDREN
eukprot:Platyproteum_vivax@DN12516_c0_g1_i1.p1